MTDMGCISISNALDNTKTEDDPVPRANEMRSGLLFLIFTELGAVLVGFEDCCFGICIVENPCFLFHLMTDNGRISI